MRVLLVADVIGGVRTFVRELVGQLAWHGVEVHLALIGPERVRVLGAASCEIRDLRLEWMHEPWSDVEATAEWIEALSARHRPDVIHMNTFSPVRCPDMPVLLTIHSCVLTWWRAVHQLDAPPEWSRYRALAVSALRRADLLTVPTHALLGELRAVYGALPPARVVPNGRSVARAPRFDEERERLVVSVGRQWDQAKNASLVIAARPEIRGNVVLIGAGKPRDEAEVRWCGQLDPTEVLSWLSRAAVFVEPARYEPFGLAALEAALCGCALVLGDIPSLREVWGTAAIYVSPEDPVGLAAAVNALLDDPERRRAAAREAWDAASGYIPSRTAEAYLDAYRAVDRTAMAV